MTECAETTSTDVLQCEHLRVTLFTVEPQDEKALGSWREVTGEEPAATSSQPRKGEHKASGPFARASLSLSIALGRIDWILAPDPERAGEELGMASVGPFSDAIKVFPASVTRWLARCPVISRLALGGAVLLPVASRVEGYEKVQSKLKDVKLDPKGSRDFLYQINRPRTSQSYEGLQLNRLTKWSVAVFVLLRMTEVSLESGTARAANPSYACRTELDLSTTAHAPTAKSRCFQELRKNEPVAALTA